MHLREKKNCRYKDLAPRKCKEIPVNWKINLNEEMKHELALMKKCFSEINAHSNLCMEIHRVRPLGLCSKMQTIAARLHYLL
jgi:hypothetical protein